MGFDCLALAGIFGLAPVENKLMIGGLCLFVGFVMVTIGKTGLWPAPSGR